MLYMNNALETAETPNDAGVAVEYQVPLTSKRVDFILSGANGAHQDTAVIVELKQWSQVSATNKDAIVRTFVGRGIREVVHPSYQAWTYAALIRDFNTEVQVGNISLHPCAYLHNCVDPSAVKASFYAAHIDQAPVFARNDSRALSAFLEQHVKYGDTSRILDRVEHGKLRPSKNLAEHLVSLLKGNREFEMIDDQKLVYETALTLSALAQGSRKQVFIVKVLGLFLMRVLALAQGSRKQVFIVEGGPGTGKSVVAINLLVELTKRELLVQYVSRNAAPRNVYASKLAGTLTKTRISNLFKGSGAYVDSPRNVMDCLIVDEAHRLNEKSGIFQSRGVNQIKEIIDAAKLSIFFLDQDQRVTLKDIGERKEINRWAEAAGAKVTELKLESQFRCNGSDGYLSWVNNALQIKTTANQSLTGIDYKFRVFDSPADLREHILALNRERNKARMVAGYCWEWKGKQNPEIKDVVIPEHDFAMRWNLDKDGFLWLIAESSVSEIGCIHTCQGLELDYVGVVIGKDFIVRNGRVITDATKRASQDRSVHGYKKMLKMDAASTRELADSVIKNTYRTLLTRGQKGCFLFCVDKETNEYFKRLAKREYDAESRNSQWRIAAESPPPAYGTTGTEEEEA